MQRTSSASFQKEIASYAAQKSPITDSKNTQKKLNNKRKQQINK